MKHLGVCITMGLCVAAWAVDGRAGEKDYVALFNGKDLSGWRYGNEKLDGKTETADKRFTVSEGTIIANEGKGIKDLYTVATFPKNFHLKLEFKAGPKADSGVYIRGNQLQVRDYIRRGEQKQLKGFKDDGWNELDITVKGGVVTTKVNNKTLTPKDALELSVQNGQPKAMLNGTAIDVQKIEVSVGSFADCLCNGEKLAPLSMSVPDNGSIGVQAETGKFEFRNLRLKELP